MSYKNGLQQVDWLGIRCGCALKVTSGATFHLFTNHSECQWFARQRGRCATGNTVEQAILISCAEVRRELSNYIENDVTPELRAQVEQHVLSCGGCKAVYDGVRNVLKLVGGGGIIELPSGFSLRLFRRLAATESN